MNRVNKGHMVRKNVLIPYEVKTITLLRRKECNPETVPALDGDACDQDNTKK